MTEENKSIKGMDSDNTIRVNDFLEFRPLNGGTKAGIFYDVSNSKVTLHVDKGYLEYFFKGMVSLTELDCLVTGSMTKFTDDALSYPPELVVSKENLEEVMTIGAQTLKLKKEA